MELTKIKGNTYYINAPTNIGVYTFKNKSCILIDTGINNTAARKIEDILTDKNLIPRYIINTHSHLDHCGGNPYFQNNYPGCMIYTSQKERLYMENPDLFASMLYSSNPIKHIERSNKPFNVDFIIDYDINKINDEKFDIISLKGHSTEQIGLITPDKVCFLGDSVFSSEIIKKYSFPNLFNIEESLKTLESIKNLDADFYIISHMDRFIDKSELLDLIDLNIKNIISFQNQILDLLDQPLTREDILENIAVLNDLTLDFREYHLCFSTISAFLTHLSDKGYIDYSVEDGRLFYFKKPS